MTHKQTFTNTSSSKCNIQSLGRQTTFCYSVEKVQVKWYAFLYTMIELISWLCIFNIIVTDRVVKRYWQCISQYLWDCIRCSFLILTINNLDTINDCIVDCFVFAKLFGMIHQPIKVHFHRIECLDDIDNLFVFCFVKVFSLTDLYLKAGLCRNLLILIYEVVDFLEDDLFLSLNKVITLDERQNLSSIILIAD